MNLLDIRDRIRDKAIDAGLTYTEIETLADTNELINQTMPCLAWQYTGERGTIAEPNNDLSLQVYLMTNYYDEIKVESEAYQRDWIVTQQNELRDYFIDWIKELNFESGVTYLEVISYEEIPIAEKLTINGLLSIEFKVNIQIDRGFCLDTESIEYLNQVKVYFNDVLRYTQAANVDLELTLKDQDGNDINATFTGNNIIVNVGGDCENVTIQVNGAEFLDLESGQNFDILVEYENGTQVGTLSEGSIIIPNPIVCADASYNLKDSAGATLSSGTIPSGGTDDIVAPDASYLVEYLNGTDIQSGTIPSGGSLTIQVPNPNQWQRPTEWLTLPTITSSNNILYGLFIVFENELNQLTFRAGTGLATIDYGDGSAVVTSNNTVQSYFYDYATISSAVNVWEDGRNYKQVIVTVTPTSTSTQQLFFSQGGTINALGNNNFADIVCAFNNNTIRLNFSSATGRKMNILKIFKCLNVGSSTLFFDNSGFQNLELEVFEIPSTLLANLATFQNSTIKSQLVDVNCGVQNTSFFRANLSGGIRDIISTGTTSFQDAKVKTCRNILNITSTDTFWGTDIQITGNVTITSSSLRRMFQNCTTRKLHIISMPSTPTNMATNGGAFTGMYNLEDFLLTGCQIGFDITGSNMSATALNALFTSLGTASGSQTITVTGNPGAATCNTSIATTKGFTVIT